MGMEETSNRGSKAVTASEMTPNNQKAKYSVFEIITTI
jgi:hypothetical protein